MNDFEQRIRAALEDLTAELRARAEEDLIFLRASAPMSPEGLARVLEDESEDPQLRSVAAWVVGLAGETSLAGTLAATFSAASAQIVIWECAKALCKLGEGNELFRSTAAAGPSRARRLAATWALGGLGDGASAMILFDLVESEVEAPELRAQAAEALGYIGDRDAVEPLMRTATDPSAEVRFWSVIALGKLGDERAVPLLERIAAEDEASVEGWGSISHEASLALEEIRGGTSPRPEDGKR